MSTRQLLVAGTLLLAAAIQSCGSSSGGDAASGGNGAGGTSSGASGTSGSGAVPTNAEIDSMIEGAICKKLFACCDMAQIAKEFMNWGSVPATADECTTMLLAPGGLPYYVLDDLPSGEIDFHPELAKSCVSEIEKADCAHWGFNFFYYGYAALEPSCQGLVRGNVADGAACKTQYGCQHGRCTNSQCYAAGELNDPCGPGTDVPNCITGLFCKGPAPYSCQPMLGEGDACTPTSDVCLGGICPSTGACPSTCDAPYTVPS